MIQQRIQILAMSTFRHTFAEKIYDVVRNIPLGSTLSYSVVADYAGFSGAARAVGSLMRKNMNPNIPCHRVVLNNGRVGAYNRGGEQVKAMRLRAEGVLVRKRTGSKGSSWHVFLLES